MKIIDFIDFLRFILINNLFLINPHQSPSTPVNPHQSPSTHHSKFIDNFIKFFHIKNS